jgi:hypothetical protein
MGCRIMVSVGCPSCNGQEWDLTGTEKKGFTKTCRMCGWDMPLISWIHKKIKWVQEPRAFQGPEQKKIWDYL